MKKKKLMSFVLALAMMFSLSLVLAADTSDSMNVRVSVMESSIGISVPESVIFEDLASGYMSARQDIDIANSGTVDIEVTPELAANDTMGVFDNLVFQDTLADPLDPLGVFKITIDKPDVAGDERIVDIYMYLDLTGFDSSEFSGDLLNHEADVIFWATAK